MDEKQMNSLRKNIAEGIIKKRVALNIYQEDLAQKVGVKRETIIRIENGKFLPNIELFLKICWHLRGEKSLHETINDILGDI